MFKILAYIAVFGFALGEECTEIEDPIKRDEGQGPFNISRVQRLDNGRNGKLVPVTVQSHGLTNSLYSGDSYVIQYSVREGRKPDVIYFWQGASSSRWEKGASAILSVQLDDSFGGVAKQYVDQDIKSRLCKPLNGCFQKPGIFLAYPWVEKVIQGYKGARVVQGSEPSHFLNMFQGTFVTLLGGIERESVTKDTDGTMLFKVKSTCNEKGDKKPLTRTNQVPEKKSELNTDDVFILKTPSALYIYEAKNASAEEKATAQKVARSLFPQENARVESRAKPSSQFTSALN